MSDKKIEAINTQQGTTDNRKTSLENKLTQQCKPIYNEVINNLSNLSNRFTNITQYFNNRFLTWLEYDYAYKQQKVKIKYIL